MVNPLRRGDVLGFVAIEELVESKSAVPTTKLTLDYFSSNKYSPSNGSDLADGQTQVVG